MIYPIYTYGDDVLRKPAVNVDLNDESLSTLIEDMFKTMHNANGAGLAAPQIGFSIKLVVIQEKLDNDELFKIILINPKILSYSTERNVMTEGCLSVPGINVPVIRPATIELEWYDDNKNRNVATFTGMKSRIIQHEIDHLNGTLFIDRIHPYEKMKIFSELENIRLRKNMLQISYPIYHESQ